MNDPLPSPMPAIVAAGRYAMFVGAQECGGERWEIARAADGYTITGELEIVSPHPFPNRQQYRLMLSPDWRPPDST